MLALPMSQSERSWTSFFMGTSPSLTLKTMIKKLKEKWDTNSPIEMLFDQIEDDQDFASAARQPYTNNQLLTMAYNPVYATGLFFDDCKAWNHLPTNQKTMHNFKTTFQQAKRELHDQQ